MRIGLMLYGDIETLSGGYLYDRKLVEYCRRQGDEVSIISLNQKLYLKALITNTIPKELQELKLDVLIQDELVHPSVFKINKKIKQSLNCPIVSLVHLLKSSIPAQAYKRMLYSSVERQYLNSIDALIFNSEHTKSFAKELCKSALLESIVAVPCGDNFKNYVADKNIFDSKVLKILFVGNISKQKGLHILLRALGLLEDKDVTLSVVGRMDINSAYVDEQKKFIKNMRLESQVKFYGAIKSAELAQFYQEHDLFILPSINEAYGIVYLEAMQFSLPVVATNEGGAKEFVENNINGYLISADDSFALAKHINLLKQDRELLCKLSKNARQSFLRHPSWEETTMNIRRFLLKLIDAKESLIDR